MNQTLPKSLLFSGSEDSLGLYVFVPQVPGKEIFFWVDTRYSNCAQRTNEGEVRASHPVLLPLPGWSHRLCLPLFFSAAGVLKGARCGSKSHGGKELGGRGA